MASFLLPKPLCFLSLVCSRSSASCLTHNVAIWLGLTGCQLLRHYIKATQRTSQSSADIHLFVCYWVISSSSFIVRWRICWLSGHHGNSRQLCPAGGGLPNVIENKKKSISFKPPWSQKPFWTCGTFSERKYCWICRIWIICFTMRPFQIVNCWCYCLCNFFVFCKAGLGGGNTAG